MYSATLLITFLAYGALAGPLRRAEFQISVANERFTSDFYNAVAGKKPHEDIFFSPLGVHTVLSMIYPGADRETRAALKVALRVPGPLQTAESYGKVITELNGVQNVTLHFENKVYLKEQYRFQEKYRTIITDSFHSEVDNSLNFGLDTKGAADDINSWVNEKTNGKIPTLFKAEDFNNDTRLVLLNAIYFKGNWAHKFNKQNTRTEPFYVQGEDARIDVQMMHRQGSYNFKTDDDLEARVLELPFNGDGMTMTIVLPKDIDGINDVEKKVQEYGIDTIFRNLEHERVKVALPKFKLETEIDLKEPLTDMGLGLLFDERKCNLLKMIDADEQLYVSKAVQKTSIEVNEDGAEATAATGSIVSLLRSGPINVYQNFYADHPFLVILRKGDTILFYGRIMKPMSANSDLAPRYEPNRAEMLDLEYDM